MERILITGAKGFCARHLIKRLIHRGCHRLYGVDIHSDPSNLPKDLHYFKMDITDFFQMEEMVRTIQPDMVFHLAGINKGSRLEIYQGNFMGTLCLLEAVRRLSPHSKILVVGSAAEYGMVLPEQMPIDETLSCRPISAYGISKYAMTLAAQEYVRHYKVKAVIVRPFNLIGGGISPSLVIGAVLDRIKQGIKSDHDPVRIAVGNLDSERDFIAVEDAVDAYIQLMSGEFWGEIFNICSGEPRSVRSILLSLMSYSNRQIILEIDPALVRPSEVQRIFGSPDKAHRNFGFKLKIPLEKAIKAAWDEAMTESWESSEVGE